MTNDTESKSNEEKKYEDIFIARQPVFKKGMNVWAYELLYRDKKLDQNAIFTDELHATLNVLNCLPLCVDLTDEQSKIIINFPPKAILEQMQTAFPRSTVIIQLTYSESPDDNLLKSINTLKQRGYGFSVDDYENDSERDSLYNLADYITIDLLDKEQKEIESLTRACTIKFPNAKLIAKRIEDYDTFMFAKKLGYEYFQGFFFKTPQIHSGKKISSTYSSKFKLFKLLQNEAVEFKEISKALSIDLAIVHRLLAYINSPALGIRDKVSSIDEALVIMGLGPLKKWLQIILLTDLTPKEKPGELVFLSIQRAHFLEALAMEHGFENLKAPLFLLGLLSLIDSILDHPKKMLIPQLALDTDLENALLEKESKYSPWLKLIECCEKANCFEIDKIAKQLGVDTKGLNIIYEDAYQKAKLFY